MRTFALLGVSPLVVYFLVNALHIQAAEATYDPLHVAAADSAEVVDFTVKDATRNREIPIRVYLPPSKKAEPVVFFSHGLGGSREGNPYLGKHWAGRGYVVVFVQHAGSDTAVWKERPIAERMQAMRDAASGRNLLLRVKDIPAVLDQLEKWNRENGHPLAGRMDLAHVGMSGHSFGASTTQAVSGEAIRGGSTPFTDKRISAALAMSPNIRPGGDPKVSFGNVHIPWLLMTGTHDASPINNTSPKDRLMVYPALPPGAKYELVLDKAEHNAFGDRALPGEKMARNPNHHRAILALSTAFWDAYLRGDKAAKAWLDGDGPSTVLEKADHWQNK